MARGTYQPATRTSYTTNYVAPTPTPSYSTGTSSAVYTPAPRYNYPTYSPMLNATAFGRAIELATNGLTLSTPAAYNAAIDATYGPVFSSYTRYPTSFSFAYNTSCWPRRMGLFNTPYPAWAVGWMCHSGSADGGLMRGVAITRRHVITSQHAGPNSDGYGFFIWPGQSDGSYVTRRVYGGVGNNQGYVGASSEHINKGPEEPNATRKSSQDGYHLYMLDQDLPDYMVCAIPNPASTPDISGRPCFIVNQDNEYPVFQIYRDADPRGAAFQSADTELLTNGGFTSETTGWTEGANWDYSSSYGGSAVHDSLSTSTLSQSIVLSAYGTYTLRINVEESSISSEALKAYQGLKCTLDGKSGTFYPDTTNKNLWGRGTSLISIAPTATYPSFSLGAGNYVSLINPGASSGSVTFAISATAWNGYVSNVSLRPNLADWYREEMVIEKPDDATYTNLAKLWRHPRGGDSASPLFTTYTNSFGQSRLVWLGGICQVDRDIDVTNSAGPTPNHAAKKVRLPNILIADKHVDLINKINYLTDQWGLNRSYYQPTYLTDTYWYR